MYLLLGHPQDICCQRVHDRLRDGGATVIMASDLFAGDARFSWVLDTVHSQSSLQFIEADPITDARWDGVLVRAFGGPTNSTGWEPADFAYVQAEAKAALLAWLRHLPCPVINRLDADLWFRPQRPVPEWHVLFARCGLPTLAMQITNDPQAARHFASQYDGSVTYAPLTSTTKYAITTAQQWIELDRIMACVPVALLEPYDGVHGVATIIDQRVIWSCPAQLSGIAQQAVDRQLVQLAHTLGVTFVQVEMIVGVRGPRCLQVQLYPNLAAHHPDDQTYIVEHVVSLLGHTTSTGRRI